MEMYEDKIIWNMTLLILIQKHWRCKGKAQEVTEWSSRISFMKQELWVKLNVYVDKYKGH